MQTPIVGRGACLLRHKAFCFFYKRILWQVDQTVQAFHKQSSADFSFIFCQERSVYQHRIVQACISSPVNDFCPSDCQTSELVRSELPSIDGIENDTNPVRIHHVVWLNLEMKNDTETHHHHRDTHLRKRLV